MFDPSEIVKAVALPSNISSSVAAPAIEIEPVAELNVKLPEVEETVLPFICKLSTKRLLILLFASVTIAELAVSSPTEWSSIFT